MQVIEKDSDRAARRVAVHDPGMPGADLGGVGTEGVVAQGPCDRVPQSDAVAGDENAGEQPHDVPAQRCKRRIVEVVEVEIDQPIVALVAAEVFQVQVAADPGRWRGHGQQAFREPLIEQVSACSQKCKGIAAHRGVLERQTLRLASRVACEDLTDDIRRRWRHGIAGCAGPVLIDAGSCHDCASELSERP